MGENDERSDTAAASGEPPDAAADLLRASPAAHRLLPRAARPSLDSGAARSGLQAPVRAQDALPRRRRADRGRARAAPEGRADLSRSSPATASRTCGSSTRGPRPATAFPTRASRSTRARSSPTGGVARCGNGSSSACPTRGTGPTPRASSPSSWSSGRPATPCSTTRSTARGCSICRREIADDPGFARRHERPAGPRQARAAPGDGHRLRRDHRVRRASCRRSPKNAPLRSATRRGRQELLKIAAVCRHVPAHAPRDFHEALQSYWFCHLGGDHGAQRLGCLQPRPSRSAPAALLRARAGRRHAHRGPGTRAARGLLRQVQQPPRAAQGGRDRGGERHLHRLREHQPSAGCCATARTGPTTSPTCSSRSSTRCTCSSPAPTSSFRAKSPDALLAPRPARDPQGLRLPVDVQRRRRRRGAAAPGQVARRRPGRRLQRLRRGGGVRQGGVHPHRVLQPREGARAGAPRRRGSPQRRAARPEHRGRPELRVLRAALRRLHAASSTTSSSSRSAATR